MVQLPKAEYKLPKVLVFTPIYEAKDYCLDKFLEQCGKLNYPNYEHIFVDNSATKKYYYDLQGKLKEHGIEVYHVARGNNSREALARAQQYARKKFLEGDYEYLLSLESDIMAPEDTIQRLILACKPVVTGLYTIGNEKIRIPCITLKEFNQQLGAWGTRLLKPEEFKQFRNSGLVSVAAGGMGVCLMKRHVVEKFPFYYDPRFTGHSDIYFFNDCLNNKIPVFVDTDLYCEHDNSDWMAVKDR